MRFSRGFSRGIFRRVDRLDRRTTRVSCLALENGSVAEVMAGTGSARFAWLWLVQDHSALDGVSPIDRPWVGGACLFTGLAERVLGRVAQAA